ncbi:MAG TPA: translation initiation factor IF-2 [Candidatus Dormibacteraeota bacterium]|jgi:translation initiation factor IF-2|nr:translation initiation factor IF-2 [Candidatus Dormibacteraeota bacterium]
MKAIELARELSISHHELLNFLKQNRLTRNPSAPLPPRAVEAARAQFRSPTASKPRVAPNGNRKVVLPPTLTVKDLAAALSVSPVDVIKKLMQSSVMATMNQVIDYGTAEIVADDFGYEVDRIASEDLVATEAQGADGEVVTTSREELFSLEHEDPAKLEERPPIVTVLGHVDHGKTSILDAIRHTKVASGEAGGITQRIGAYRVQTADGAPVVFIDTPGHEAFTAMRSRGAQVTDVVVLVVAADDGVMPQTVEAIQHAKAADVPIVVAINKIDTEGANVDRVHAELAEHEVVTIHYGGPYECVHVSARTGQGLDDLLTTIVLSAEILELKANPYRNAIGTVVDANLERGRGPVATVLVQNGTLHVGDHVVCGHIFGRVRALSNDMGAAVTEAGPATPVVVSGLSEVPSAGDILQVVASEKAARQITLQKQQERRSQEATRELAPRLTLEELGRRAKAGEVKELNLVVKADMQGTLEAVLGTIQKIEDPVVTIKVVGSGVGAVNESDVLLAGVSNAIIIGFNTRANAAAERAAERDKVELRSYDVIYKLAEDIERAAKGLREPSFRQVWEGKVEVITPIRIPRMGTIAGSRVVDGKVSRGGYAKLTRGRQQVWEGRIRSLKHYKEDVREMVAGDECGIGLEGYDVFEQGDTMDTFRLELEEI